MRTETHIIDTKAVRAIINVIPDYWVIRDLSERDYGIDMMIEIFRENGTDSKGKIQYIETGKICFLQIKGKYTKTNAKDGCVGFDLSKKSLLYMEKFSTPFILVHVHNLKNTPQINFVWIQRYVKDFIEKDSPHWRTENFTTKKIYIPIKNDLNNLEARNKIERISTRIKYIEEYQEFLERFENIKRVVEHDLPAASPQEKNTLLDKIIDEFIRIKLLLIFFEGVHSVDMSSIDILVEIINSIKRNTSDLNNLIGSEHYSDLEMASCDHIHKMDFETFLAEQQGETVY